MFLVPHIVNIKKLKTELQRCKPTNKIVVFIKLLKYFLFSVITKISVFQNLF